MRWKPQPPPSAPGPLTRQTAAAFFREHTGASIGPEESRRDVIDALYRQAAKKLHHDQGGSHDLFLRLQEAREVLLK